MWLADEFFLIALDDRTGRPRLSSKVFGLGLAGALLGELILDRRITVEEGQVLVVDHRPPADALAHTVLDQILSEVSPYGVRSWLVFLARNATERVADRLSRAGHIRREQSRRMFRRETVYPPTDMNAAHLPLARLATSLRNGRQVSWTDAVLLGLVMATGLDDLLLFADDDAAREYLTHLVEHLTPPLYVLVWHLHAAVGDAVLTGRT